MPGDPGFPSKWTGFPGHITAKHKTVIFQKNRTFETIGSRNFRKTLVIRKNINIKKKNGTVEKFGVMGISGRTSKIRKSDNIQKKLDI